MTRKDYILIADVLKVFAQTDLKGRDTNEIIHELVGKLAYQLHKDNNKFDFDKFDNYIYKK